MPPRPRTPRRLSRADLPAEFTPDSVRRLGFRVLRELQRPDNGILTPAEQQQFDAAAETVFAEFRQRVRDAEGRASQGGPGGLDPQMRRSYARASQRLAEQARRTRETFPELGDDEPESEAPVEEDAGDDDVSVDTLSDEIEETSTTLELLDRIASIQQQQLEHQESQLLTETRSVFFAFLVSVSVIIAGVAPLVEAEPHARLLIVLWTVAAILLAGGVYAGVRAVQRRTSRPATTGADEPPVS